MQKSLLFSLVALVVIVATTPRTHVRGRTLDVSNKIALESNPTGGLLRTGGSALGRYRHTGRNLAGYTWRRHSSKHGHPSGHKRHPEKRHGGDRAGHRKRDLRSRNFWYRMFRRRQQRRYGSGRPRQSPADSASISRLRGVLIIVAYGDGDMCFTKVYQRGMAVNEQFGDSSTSTNGFIDLYGEAECEEGARGFAYGVVKASVLAEAKRRGDECEAKVISEVMVKVTDLDPDDGVSVLVGGAAGGDALAVCN